MKRQSNKKVEIDVDRDDINKADLKSGVKPNRQQRRSSNKSHGSSTKPRNNNKSKFSHSSKTNDPKWHSGSNQLASDAASFAQRYPIGVKLPQGYSGIGSAMEREESSPEFQNYDPALFVMDFIPTVGLPLDSQAPINQAARLQYSFVRYANSGSPVGNPSHLMRFYVAADSLFLLHQHGVRAYGVLNLVNYENQYLPKTLVEGLGFDYDDLIANTAQFRYNLNIIAMKLRRITVPNNMDYQKRHLWMVQGIYTDSESPRAQMYAFRPSAVYKYVEAEDEKLVYKELPNKFTVASFTEVMNELLAAVLESESFGVTTADILKAYGGENLLILPEISDIYSVLPIYSEEVLGIIENAVVWDLKNFDYLTALEVVDDKSPLSDNWMRIQRDYFETNFDTYPEPSGAIGNKLITLIPNIASGLTYGWKLNTHKVLNPDETLTYTSLTTPAKLNVAIGISSVVPNTYATKVRLTLTSLRAELIVGARLYLLNYNSSAVVRHKVITKDWTTPSIVRSSVVKTTGAKETKVSDIQVALPFYAALENFDQHPVCPFQEVTLNATTNASEMVEYKVGQSWYYSDGRDVENFVLLTTVDLNRMAELDMISLFDAPEIAIMSSKPYHKA